jgi:hypothetical protein
MWWEDGTEGEIGASEALRKRLRAGEFPDNSSLSEMQI